MVLRLCIPIAAAFVLGSTAVMAVPQWDELEIQLEGEAEGWLNSTCTYYALGWIPKEKASGAIKKILLQLGHFIEHRAVDQAAQAALSRDPGCQAIWPISLD